MSCFALLVVGRSNGGIKQSFTAWQASRAGGGAAAAQRLPGLPELSPEQLFFLSYSQVSTEQSASHYDVCVVPNVQYFSLIESAIYELGAQ